MRYETIEGLRNCPVCGFSAVMKKNASKRFQVHCKKCKCCTTWTSKVNAVVLWYNNADTYEKINGMKGVITLGTLFEDYNTAMMKPEAERTDAEKALIAKIDEIRQAEIQRLSGKKE